jgi:hypothetical protein
MTIQEALREWVDASPNKTPRNTLIKCRAGNRTFYRWNLKPVDPNEKDFVWIEEETNNKKLLTHQGQRL